MRVVQRNGGVTVFSHSWGQTGEAHDGAAPRLHLRHRSPRGEDGYPGEVVVDAEFALVDDSTLEVVMQARSDVDTPLSLTLHPYFNLNGDAASTVENHHLRIDSRYILPLGAARLPTGELMPVARTPFESRVARPIGAAVDDAHPQLKISGGYDHYFVLDEGAAIAADVYSPASSLGLRMRTNQKGLQFYSGNQLDEAAPSPFLARSGLCLEPHAFPNAINEPRFPDITLRAGEVYRSQTSYTFYTRRAQD